MSRTEGISLPRLPTSHTRLTSPQSIKVHPGVARPPGTAGGGWSGKETEEKREWSTNQHRRSISEPSYTAYVGTHRQDIPHHVYRDAAMFDDVFEKQGRLFQARDTPKIANPLNSLGYSSLHDPHCRKLFLNNKKLRSHLMDLGLITDDLKVVASTHEQRQKIRAHELLERKETLLHKLETQEQTRINRLQQQALQLPLKYRERMLKAEERRERADKIQQMKLEKIIHAEEQKKKTIEAKRKQEKNKLQQAIEEARLYEQAKRNAARYQQESAELAAYEKHYGKFGHQMARWHRDSDRIHNRMVLMQRKYWEKKRENHLSESYPPVTSTTTSSIITTTKATPQPVDSSRYQADVKEEDTSDKMTLKVQPETQLEEKVEDKLKDLDIAGDQKVIKVRQKQADDKDNTKGDREEELKETEVKVTSSNDDVDVTNYADTASDKVIGAVVSPPLVVEEEVTVLGRDQSDSLLSKILIDLLHKFDHSNQGFVTMDDFTQVLNSRDLGLQLNENELVYVTEQSDMYGNGWVPFVQVVPRLPDLLLAIYKQRAEGAVQHYGAYMEETWCQIYPPTGGVCYYNKLTGEMQTVGRPDDLRPMLKEDPFEESIVDFFETADTDKDGMVDINNFYALLVSPMVSTRIYSNQMEDLLELFQRYSNEGLMGLEGFSPIANTLLLMIYQNAYPDVEEWIELDSRKFGTFFFNKVSGETYIPTATKEPSAQLALEEDGEDGATHTLTEKKEMRASGAVVTKTENKVEFKPEKNNVDVTGSKVEPKPIVNTIDVNDSTSVIENEGSIVTAKDSDSSQKSGETKDMPAKT